MLDQFLYQISLNFVVIFCLMKLHIFCILSTVVPPYLAYNTINYTGTPDDESLTALDSPLTAGKFIKSIRNKLDKGVRKMSAGRIRGIDGDLAKATEDLNPSPAIAGEEGM